MALYPRAWRTRYETEFQAVLADRPATSLADRLDIVRGALDAHLHPEERSAVPPISAVLGGGMWVLVAASIIALPAPPDWPGYLLETVPLALAGVIALGVAIIGCWLRLDRSGDRSVRRLGAAGVAIAIVGNVLWSTALLAAVAGVGYGAPVALASTMAGVGTLLVGLALARAADWPIAGLLVIAPVLLVLPPWLISSGPLFLSFGLAWIGIGLTELADRARTLGPTGLAA